MKILFILPRFPFPLEKGDKLRAYNQIRYLASNNEVYLFALSHQRVDDNAVDEMSKFCKDICVARLSKIKGALRVVRNFFSVRSLQIGYWDSRRARSLYRDFEAKVRPDVVYAQMVRTMKYAAHSTFPRVLDFQDALSMNFERRMLKHRSLSYFVLHYEFKMLRSAEFNACGIFDRLTVISERDSEAIPQHKDTVIDIVRNGVDFDYFRPIDMPKEYDVVFCGNMQYRPNIDASLFLAEEVMPIVWQSRPEAKLLLAGATPKGAVRQLASERVTVTGSVDDIRPCYASAHVFVAPMRIGSGLQNKLLEAMSMGIPCVTTSLANASLGASDRRHILVADDATSIAQSIVRLLDDRRLRDNIASEASAFVHDNFSWQSAVGKLETILRQAMTSSNKHEEKQLEEE
ncbi:MAG: glycosyltransferase [Bacteroidales bacterium]|nr:glycosyltransferase [Bacteroidales bacterium]